MVNRCVRLLVRLSLIAVTVAGVLPPAALTPAAASSVLTVYMAPSAKGGNDRHTGLAAKSPVLTLARVQKILATAKPKGDVVVRITPGTYVAGPTNWKFYVPAHTISFMPATYTPGHARPAGGDPVFLDSGHGSKHTAGWWFQAQEPGSGPLHNGGTTGLRFYYLSVQGYTNGISFDGQTGHADHDNAKPPLYTKPSAGLNGNWVSGMTFLNIGDKFASGQIGFGAILLTDSSGNTITNNTFQNVENTGSSWGQIHGIYVTHFSGSNTITRNLFESITSYAVKVRDRSNFNTISGNRFQSTGALAAFEDEECYLACAKQNPGTPRQCASYDNRFTSNTIGTVFGSSKRQAVWYESPGGQTNAGGSGCSIPKGQVRLHTSGNT